MSSDSSKDFNPLDWISQAEAATLRGVSRQAIHQLVAKGRFRTCEIAGRVLVLRDDVISYVAEPSGRPSPPPHV